MKILIVGPSWVGDAVMAQTLFKLIKENNNNTIIDVLVPSWALSVFKRMKEINQFIEMPFGHGELRLKERRSFALGLKVNNYDQAIVLPNSLKSSLIPFFADIPIRTGWRGEFRYFFINDIRKLDKKDYPRMVDRFCALGIKKGKKLPEIKSPSLISDKSNISKLINLYSIYREKKILTICPGAEFGPAKRWPSNYFAEVVTYYLRKDWIVIVIGSKKDQIVAQEIESSLDGTHPNLINTVGNTNLEDAIDLLSISSLALTNDSGLMHIASALDIPLLALFGPTSPEFTPPLGEKSEIIRKVKGYMKLRKGDLPGGYHSSLLSIKPKETIDKLESMEKIFISF